ncbi:E3 ubiquitin-protein ligase XIAP-like [Haliotis rubra]|uniref:E3 ubiquitin-protein ligase XIAP-like n=1 Tax=Haliotis rubra TaxID=36100 RepID=UPI001EE5E8A9|nr:E3 ubiquitin-protein ligase XIAP-like [Haliotis rubra]XP_046545288.1 E3 ubiquitin-protein ligase XIAP-like [Haliotis rubra]
MSSPTGSLQQNVPRHSHYQTYNSRVESFVSWPGRYVPKTPEQLATAGFFYIGSADRVTCFQCGITLRDWGEEHDPAAEHQRYSEHCPFIKRLEEQEGRIDDLNFGPPLSNIDETNGVSQRPPLSNTDETNGVSQGPPLSNTDETNRGSQRRAAGAPKTNNIISNFNCLDIRKQLKLIVGLFFSDPLVDKQDQTPQDVSALEVKISTLKRSGEDSATFLKTTDQNEKENPESMFPCNANARNSGTREQLGMCRLCTKKDVSVIFLPCGHFVTCKSCANKVDTCMTCKMDILGRTNAAVCKSPVM